MTTPYVYLAHPIDFADPENTRRLVGNVATAMHLGGLAAYIPGYAFKTPMGAKPSPVVNRINTAALEECDGLIAFLPPPGAMSFGVPMEIQQARSQGKPICVVGDQSAFDRSVALAADFDTQEFHVTDFTSREAETLGSMIRHNHRMRNRPASTQPLYVRCDAGGALPTRAYDGDAGFDLYVNMTTTIPARGFVDVPMGCSVQFPDHVWGMITGRSSALRTHQLLITTGIIDTGYRGPLYAGVQSLRDDDYTVKRGERIAQLIPFPNVAMSLHATQVDVLTPSNRGEAGFGSSGA